MDGGSAGPPCPQGHLHSKVLESRPVKSKQAMRRSRQCLTCGDRFTTYEYRHINEEPWGEDDECLALLEEPEREIDKRCDLLLRSIQILQEGCQRAVAKGDDRDIP